MAQSIAKLSADSDHPDVEHPRWCEESRCSARRRGSMLAAHRSSKVHGPFDPDTEISVDVSLWRRPGHQTHILIEFPGGSGEGNDLTPGQAAQLAAMLHALLSTCTPEEFRPTEPDDTTTVSPLPVVAAS